VNQAVRHKLAEAYTETVGARAVVARAWEDGARDGAAWAWVVAANAADAVGKHAMQVCGAIGLSAEHAVPQLVKRAFLLDALARPAVTAPVGQLLLAGQVVEPLGAF
jgi:alkylation response protein AidB-like acyl-CoA dehydrogenase